MTFGKTDITLSTVLLLLLLGISVAGIAVADASFGADSEETGSTAYTGADVEIDKALADADGEVQVIVRFEPADRMVVQASADPVETLKAKADVSQEPLQRYATRTDGVTVENEFWLANAALVTVDTRWVSLEEVAQVEGVERIERNGKVTAHSTSVQSGRFATASAPRTTWGLNKIDAPEVWDTFETRGEGTRVAVLDTGVDASHQDISLYTTDDSDASYPGGWQEFGDDGNPVDSQPYDCEDHGTHTSGTVAGGNSSGTHIGVAPDAELLHGGVLVEAYEDKNRCYGYRAQIIAGMQWAVEQNADIVSMSLGGDRYDSFYAEEVFNAEEAGTLVVASAGNSGETNSSSPGNGYDSFAVGAAYSWDDIADFSSGELVPKGNFSSPKPHWPDEWIVPNVAAPGGYVNSSVPNDGYDEKHGTSMAAPHVAGAAALMESATERDLSPDEIKKALEETAWKPDDWDESDALEHIDEQDTRYGHGIIDVYAATTAVTTGTVNGTVTDAQTSEVIEGATVTIDAASSGWSNTTQTDASGSYTFKNASELDEYTVTVTAGGYETSSKTVEPVGMTTVTEDVSLDGNATLEGTVVDAAEKSQAAISERPVDITVTYEDGSSFSTSATTAADGTVQLSALRGSSTVDLTLSADGYHTNTTESIQVADDEDVSGVTIALTGNATLSGTVTDSHGGALPGVTVAVENGSRTYENATVSDGSYEVSLPGTGAKYNLSVDAAGYAPWNESGIEVDGDVPRDITLTAGTTLSGTVTDSETGARLPSIIVTVKETAGDGTKVTTTDETGSYAIGVAENTAYNLSIDADGYEPWNATEVQIGTGAVTQNAALIGEADVSYHVNDRIAKAPIENATVSLTSDLIGKYNGTTDESGQVTIANVSSAATYARSVDAEGYQANKTVTEVDAGQREKTISLLGDATVGGIISDAASSVPLSGATVTVIYTDGTTVVGSNETADDGSFFVTGIPGNGSTYGITVTANGYDRIADSIRANESEDVLYDRTLAGNASINGTVSERRSGDGVGGAELTITYSDGTTTVDGITTNENGEFTVSDVPGTGENYTVSVAATGYESATNDSVAVASDAETPVKLTLTGAATIDGRIVDGYVDWTTYPYYLENATVTVTYPDGVTTVDPVQSDANGNFSVEDLPGTGKMYEISASATGYETSSGTVWVGEGGAFDYIQLAGNASINGTVTSSDGEKLTGIQINATSESGRQYTSSTDTNGAYQHERIPGTGENYTVSISHPLFETETVTVPEVTADVTDVNATLTQKAHYFAIGGVSAPDTATEGDTVEISANIANFGSADGERPVRLLVNGTEHTSRNVSLNATDSLGTYDNTTVAFTHVPESPGEVTYTIETDEETMSATVAVEESSGGGGGLPLPPPSDPEPSLYLVGTALETDELAVGETGSVAVTVSNTGDAVGEKELELTHEGAVLDTASVSVPAGERTEATLAFAFDEPGTYDLAVNGETVGAVDVSEAQSEPANESGENESRNETVDDTTPDSDGLSGFGGAAVLVALVSAALATTRQR